MLAWLSRARYRVRGSWGRPRTVVVVVDWLDRRRSRCWTTWPGVASCCCGWAAEMPAGVLVALGSSRHEPAVLTAVDTGRCTSCADASTSPTCWRRQPAGRPRLRWSRPSCPGSTPGWSSAVQSDGVVVVGVVPTLAVGGRGSPACPRRRAIASADDIVTLVELVSAVVVDAPAPTPATAASRRGSSRDARGRSAARRGTVIAVWGPTGAPGRSTVAMGLAAALAERGRRDAADRCRRLWRLDGASSSACSTRSSGLLAAARAANAGVAPAWCPGRACAHASRPGLRVLTGLPRADRWTEVKAVLMGRIVADRRGSSPSTSSSTAGSAWSATRRSCTTPPLRGATARRSRSSSEPTSSAGRRPRRPGRAQPAGPSRCTSSASVRARGAAADRGQSGSREPGLVDATR